MRIATWACRIILGGLFLYSGLVKLGASEIFAIAVASFGILPGNWATAFAVVLPYMEILAAVLILLPWTVLQGALFIGMLLLIFMAALTWAFSQGLILDCSCFGKGIPSIMKMRIAFAKDVVLLAMAIFVVAQVRIQGMSQKIPASVQARKTRTA